MSKFAPVVKLLHRGAFLVKKFSPEILTGVGLIGVGASGVMLVRAGMKTPQIVEEHKQAMAFISENDDLEQIKTLGYKQYADTTRKFLKVYSMPVTIGLVGVSCIVGGHGQLRKRNFAYAAAYKALDETFQKYRANAEALVGPDDETMIRYGATIEETETPDGEIKSRKVIRSGEVSEYARTFGVGNKNWQGDPDCNIMFLRSAESYLNDILEIRGHVNLNDVYDSLGFERTKAGQNVGWRLNNGGDNFIDFGVNNWENIFLGATVDGIEGNILLDFNVDGVIW